MWDTQSLIFRDLLRSRNLKLGQWPDIPKMLLPDQTVFCRTLDYISTQLTLRIWKWAGTVCKICYGKMNIICFYITFRICHIIKPHFNKTTPDMKIPSLYPIFHISTYSLHSDVSKEYFRFTPLHPIIHFIRARYILVTSGSDCT